MPWFRAVASASQTLQVPLKKRTNWVWKCLLVFPKQGGADWECTAPTSLLSIHKPCHSCIAAICVLWGNSKNTCRSGTWNQETYLNLLYTPLEVWIWHFKTFYILLSIHLALRNPATFSKKSWGRVVWKWETAWGFLAFFSISHPKALMFSIPSPTTETRAFGEVNSKEKERKWKGSEK